MVTIFSFDILRKSVSFSYTQHTHTLTTAVRSSVTPAAGSRSVMSFRLKTRIKIWPVIFHQNN